MFQNLIRSGLIFSMAMIAMADDIDTRRIVSVDANATAILIGFGLANNLVAVDVTSKALIQDRALPDLGYHRALSAEGLLSAEPSLIVGSNHMGPQPVVETLKSAAVPLVQLQAAMTVEELTANIHELGQYLDANPQAEQMIETVQYQNQLIQQRNNGQELRMVFLLNMSERGLSKAGKGTTGEALIHLLGGENLSVYGGYQSIAMEALLELNPDVILIGSEQSGTDAAKEFLANHPLLMHSNAVQNGRLLDVDAAKMVAGVSLGVVNEAERLSRLIY